MLRKITLTPLFFIAHRYGFEKNLVSVFSRCINNTGTNFSRSYRAYHEAGHAIGLLYQKTGHHIDFATIHPGKEKNAGRVTVVSDLSEQTFEKDLAYITSFLSGAAAIEIGYHKSLSVIGAGSDFRRAELLCTEILKNWSEEIKEKIGDNIEENDVLKFCYQSALDLLKSQISQLNQLAKEMYEQTEIEAEAIYELLQLQSPFKVIQIDLGAEDLNVNDPALRTPVLKL